MVMRGIKKVGSKTVTIAKKGIIKDDVNLGQEIMTLMNR